MKKIPLILLTMLISLSGGQLFSAKTQALYIDEDNTTWYTVAELLDYKKEVEKEKSDLCGDDQGCREEWFFEQIEYNQKLLALDRLEQYQFTITSINPKEETFKVLAFDENTMLKRWGIREKVTINNFYLTWFETEEAQKRTTNYGVYKDELLNNTLPETHTIFSYRKNTTQPNFPYLTNVETEYKMISESNIIADPFGMLGYLVDGKGYNAVGYIPYRNCLEFRDYSDGEECRLMISAEKGTRFFPPRETIINNRDTDFDKTEAADKNDDSISDASDNEPTKEATDKKSEKISHEAEDILPKAPDTGYFANPCTQKTIEFPWWLVILIALGDIVVLWFFYPKKSKKSKKSLDRR